LRKRLLLPQKIYLDDNLFFFQEKGVPQGSPLSSLLFITYLDELLKESGLLNHKLKAYVDDLVFIASSESELHNILLKLKSLLPYLAINESKCGIITTGNILKDIYSFEDIPIVKNYKYLGFQVSSTTKLVLKSAMSSKAAAFHS
jgi:retron-type reverse transcriptase